MESTSRTDDSTVSTSDSAIPSEYDDLSPRLIPVLETPGEWFQEPVGQYETTLGPFGDISGLTPAAVTFHVSVRRDQYPELFEWKGEHYVGDRNTLFVPNRTAAEGQDEPAVWVSEDDVHAHLYERVPFEERVTSLDELQDELDTIMENTPEWEELFAAVDDVAADMGLIDTIDTVEEGFEKIASEIHQANGGKSMEEHVEAAAEKLTDDDLIAFTLVGIRKTDDGYETGYNRVIDPAVVRHADNPERFVDKIHEAMVAVFQNEVDKR